MTGKCCNCNRKSTCCGNYIRGEQFVTLPSVGIPTLNQNNYNLNNIRQPILPSNTRIVGTNFNSFGISNQLISAYPLTLNQQIQNYRPPPRRF